MSRKLSASSSAGWAARRERSSAGLDDTRALLDSLMGSHRDVDLKEAKAKKGNNFKEDNICKFHLVGFCPQYEELFVSTKRDIGVCCKVHSDAMKTELEQHPEKEKFTAEYEKELKIYLEELARLADEWVVREQRSIQKANAQIEETGPNEVAKNNIKQLNKRVSVLLEEAGEAAEAGRIEESKDKMDLVQDIKAKVAWWEAKAKALRTEDVCEVCGARMESGDVESAREKHLETKIHLGYKKIRDWLADLRKKGKDDDEKRGTRDKEESDRDYARDADRRRDGRNDREQKRGTTDANETDTKERYRSRSGRRDDREHTRDSDRRHDDRPRDSDCDRRRDGRDDRDRQRDWDSDRRRDGRDDRDRQRDWDSDRRDWESDRTRDGRDDRDRHRDYSDRRRDGRDDRDRQRDWDSDRRRDGRNGCDRNSTYESDRRRDGRDDCDRQRAWDDRERGSDRGRAWR